jgi:phosphotriesterase-related protein
MTVVPTYGGNVEPAELGVTLLHEHVFVRDLELERNGAAPEWDEADAVRRAVDGLRALHDLGVRTIVDLTVPGLGRDVRTVAEVARQVPVAIVAATGWYLRDTLPLHFALRGPGRTIDVPDELADLFVRDIVTGIAGTGIRAGMLKVVTDEAGLTPDACRVLEAAPAAHLETGVAITTHSVPATHNGLDQQRFLVGLGVPLDRVVVGHSGDTDDVPYLRSLMDAGSTVGMDRFGMEHVQPDGRRTVVVAELVRLGYADRMILSHDAAFYSHVTPPSWRAAHAPNWHMQRIPTVILSGLRELGVDDDALDQMLVRNPARLLEPVAEPGGRG